MDFVDFSLFRFGHIQFPVHPGSLHLSSRLLNIVVSSNLFYSYAGKHLANLTPFIWNP